MKTIEHGSSAYSIPVANDATPSQEAQSRVDADKTDYPKTAHLREGVRQKYAEIEKIRKNNGDQSR